MSLSIFDQPPSAITPTLNRVSEMGSGLIQWTVFCRVAMGRRCSTRTGVCWLMTNSFCSVSLERSSGVTGPLRLCTSAVYDLVLSSSPLFRCAVCSLWSDQVRSGQVRSGQVRSGQVMTGTVRPGQARVCQRNAHKQPMWFHEWSRDNNIMRIITWVNTAMYSMLPGTQCSQLQQSTYVKRWGARSLIKCQSGDRLGFTMLHVLKLDGAHSTMYDIFIDKRSVRIHSYNTCQRSTIQHRPQLNENVLIFSWFGTGLDRQRLSIETNRISEG